jgi:integrase/recombinase XerD
VNLRRSQYTGKGFTKVRVKGGHIRDNVPVQRGAREVLNAYLEAREEAGEGSDLSGPIFTTRTGRRMDRREATYVLQRIADQANAHLSEEERIEVTPHVLRHTFLRKLAESKGVHYAKEASGHQSDRYIWRYVQPDRQTLAEAIDALEEERR